jgi:hypothetical protein
MEIVQPRHGQKDFSGVCAQHVARLTTTFAIRAGSNGSADMSPPSPRRP